MSETGARGSRRRWSAGSPLLHGLIFVTSRLSLPAIHRFGALCGWLVNTVPNTLRHTARRNVAACFPDQPVAAQRRLARAAVTETAKTAAELAAVLRWPTQRLLTQVVDTRGETHLRAALDGDRGVIVAVPHLGCWELAGLYLSARTPMVTLYRPGNPLGMAQALRRARAGCGAVVVPAERSGLARAHRALAAGGVVGLLPDQDPGRRRGIFAPFFNLPAKTSTLLPRLARATGAAVIFCYVERRGCGAGYYMHFLPADAGVYAQDIAEAATAVNRSVETCVRQLPAQYQWCYQRFRTRPAGAPAFY